MTTPSPLAGRTITVFGSSTLRPEEPGWPLAVSLGRALAEAGARVMNGGYGGAMEAVSRGAREGGGAVVGVTVGIFAERLANEHLTETLHTETLHRRLEHLLGADGFVALEGSVGTLTEFFLAWNLVMLEASPPRRLVCLGPRWRKLLPAVRRAGMVSPEALWELVTVADDAAHAVSLLATPLPTRLDPGAASRG